MPSLLILRCDVERLRADGLALENETELAAQLAQFGLGARAVVVSATNRADLLRRLGGLRGRFEVAVLVGHSSEAGLQIASDQWADWPAVARYLAPFAPKRLLLAACSAGGWPAAAPLFAHLPSLRHLFASPAKMNLGSAKLLLFLLAHVMERKAPDRDAVDLWRNLTPLLTGGQLRHWRLARGGKIDPGKDILLDVFASG